MSRTTIAALAMLGLLACGDSTPSAVNPPPCAGASCSDGGSATPPKAVTILYTGNVGGYLEPCG